MFNRTIMYAKLAWVYVKGSAYKFQIQSMVWTIIVNISKVIVPE